MVRAHSSSRSVIRFKEGFFAAVLKSNFVDATLLISYSILRIGPIQLLAFFIAFKTARSTGAVLEPTVPLFK